MMTIIIEYHLTDVGADRMRVKNFHGDDVALARQYCASLRRVLNARPNVIVDTWRIEDSNENVVARASS
jgi:hypothetical protein